MPNICAQLAGVFRFLQERFAYLLVIAILAGICKYGRTNPSSWSSSDARWKPFEGVLSGETRHVSPVMAAPRSDSQTDAPANLAMEAALAP